MLSLKLALASIGSENGENKSVLLSIGIEFIIFAPWAKLKKIYNSRLLTIYLKAPLYFLIDIQKNQKESLIDSLKEKNLISHIKTVLCLEVSLPR